MSRALLLSAALFSLALLAGSPRAGAEAPASPHAGDTLAAALQAELDRSFQELSLPEAPPLYHVRYHLGLLRQVSATASQGALITFDASPLHLLGVEVRVGSPAFDNTGFGGWETGFGRGGLPCEPTPLTVRYAAWRLTDRAYKTAVEQFARKEAGYTPPPDHPGDYEMGHSHQADRRQEGTVVPPALARTVLDLSRAFPVDAPLEHSAVLVVQERGDRYTLDTEGTAVWRTSEELVLRAMGWARSEDGMLLSDHRSWIVRDPEDLPESEQMARAVRDLSSELARVREAPPFEEEYVGPVLFTDEATLDLFRVLLVPQLEGTPPPVPFQSRLGDLGGSFLENEAASRSRLGRRVLPDDWTVVDDPRADPDHPAAFHYDLEGTPSQRVTLVTDGIVRTVLMCRIPRKGVEGTNGHARGGVGSRPQGRAALLEVTPDRRLGERRLRRRGLRLAADYGLDHFLLVRRFQDPGVRAHMDGAGMVTIGFSEGPRLPLPVEVIRVYADGREQPLRGAMFSGVERWVLRDIAAAGEQVEGTWLAPFQSGRSIRSATAGMPTGMSAPEVLVGELEVVPMPTDPKNRRVLPPPPPPGGGERG